MASNDIKSTHDDNPTGADDITSDYYFQVVKDDSGTVSDEGMSVPQLRSILQIAPGIPQDIFSMSIPLNTLNAIVGQLSGAYTHWQILETDVEPIYTDTNWNDWPMPTIFNVADDPDNPVLADWSLKTWHLYTKDAATVYTILDQTGEAGIDILPSYIIPPPVPTGITAVSDGEGTGSATIEWTNPTVVNGLESVDITVYKRSDLTIVGGPYLDKTSGYSATNLPMGIDLYATVTVNSEATPTALSSSADSADFDIDISTSGTFLGVVSIDKTESGNGYTNGEYRDNEATSGAGGNSITVKIDVSDGQDTGTCNVTVRTIDTGTAVAGAVKTFDCQTDVDSGGPNVLAVTAHGMTLAGTPFVYKENAQGVSSNTDTVGGLTDGETYYAGTILTNSFKIYTTEANAVAETGAVSITAAASSETHYIIYGQYEKWDDIEIPITVTSGTGTADVEIVLVDNGNTLNNVFQLHILPAAVPSDASFSGLSLDNAALIYIDGSGASSNSFAIATLASDGFITPEGFCIEAPNFHAEDDQGESQSLWTLAEMDPGAAPGSGYDFPTEWNNAEGNNTDCLFLPQGEDRHDPNTYLTESPRRDWNLDFGSGNTGVYYLYVYGYYPSSAKNKAWPGMDGSAVWTNGTNMILFGVTTGSYKWYPVTVFQVGGQASVTISTDGVHTFNLWAGQDGFVINKFIICDSASYIPENIGTGNLSTGGGDTIGPAENAASTGTTSDNPANPNFPTNPDDQTVSEVDYTSANPSDGATGVGVLQEIKMLWAAGVSEIQATSFVEQTVSGSIAVPGSLAEGGVTNEIIWTPSSPRTVNTLYEIVANGTLRDVDNAVKPWSIG